MKREKKEYFIYSFKSTTQAIAGEQYCKEHGVGGRMIPLPAQISAGCGLAWRISSDEYEIYEDKLKKLDYEGFYKITM